MLGACSAYTFHLYGRLSHETQATNMGELWEHTKGKNTSWIISASTFSFCFGVAVAYSLVIGDFLAQLAKSFGGIITNNVTMTALLGLRQFWILSIALSTLAPLCNLKSLKVLAPMALLGTIGSLSTALFMAVRCPAIFPGSPYSIASTTTGAVGQFAKVSFQGATPTQLQAPQFNTFSQIVSPASLIIAAMAVTAYLGHFNAVDIYRGFLPSTEHHLLAEDETNMEEGRQLALKKFSKTTCIGFGLVTMLNVLVMSFGFLTFGGNCSSIVLNNYALTDRGAVLSRLFMTVSVIGGYPFMIRACKLTFVQLYNQFKGSNVLMDAFVSSACFLPA